MIPKKSILSLRKNRKKEDVPEVSSDKAGIKDIIKNAIRDRIIDECVIDLVNGKIVLLFRAGKHKVRKIKLNEKSYTVKNNKAVIPNKEGNLNYIFNEPILMYLEVGNKVITADLPLESLRMGEEKLSVNSRTYTYDYGKLVRIHDASIGTDGLDLSYSKVIDDKKELRFLLVDKKYNENIEAEKVADGHAVFSKDAADALLDKERIQILAVSGKSAYPLVLEQEDSGDGELKTIQVNNRVFIERRYTSSYSFETDEANRLAKPLRNKSENVVFNLDYKGSEAELTADLNCKAEISFTWIDLLTGERRSAGKFKANQKCVMSFVKYTNEQRPPLERSVLAYKLTKDGKTIERDYVFVEGARKRIADDHVIMNGPESSVICTYLNTLVLQNNDCYLHYQKKYDYDFAKSSFKTEIDDLVITEDRQLRFDLSIHSLLQPISSIVLFARDNYKKHAYFIQEILFDKTGNDLTTEVSIDLGMFDTERYDNMRLSFRIGVRYNNGYAEEGFVCAETRDYKVRERYLYERDCDDMVYAAYLGENKYNLNIWYSSREEYEKGVNYQEGRETYLKTVKEEDIDNHLILFEANLGKNYTGNPKYLYEYMISHPEYSKFKYVWAYPDPEENPIPGDPVVVSRGTPEYFYYLAKAKYRINNIRFPVPHKKQGVIYLNTWHGTPLKKLGFDIECEGPEKQAFGSLYQESCNWDYMTVDNDYGEEKLVGAFRFRGKVIKKGYPINDIYYDDERKSKAKERLEKLYPAIKGKTVILYAPTWRDLKGDYVRGYEFELPFDTEELYNAIGKDHVIVVKLHHLIADNLVIDDKYKDFIINASTEEDVMELLCMTDILITDYSSVFYDFASVEKPILFYMYDLEEYLNETRGTYVSVDTLPGPIIRDQKALIENILDIRNGKFKYTDRLHEFCQEFAKYCKGTSSRDVIETIIEKEDLE